MIRAILISILLCGCAGKDKRHRSPDRTKMHAAAMRVQKAIPVVQKTHDDLKRSVDKIKGTHDKIAELHAAEKAQIDALEPSVAKIRELAFRTNPTDVDLQELKSEVEKLESTVGQLRSTFEISSMEILSNSTDVSQAKLAIAEQQKAIDELRNSSDNLSAETGVVIEGYETLVSNLRTDLEVKTQSNNRRGNWLGWMGAATGAGLAFRFVSFVVPWTYAIPVAAATGGYFLARGLIS